MIERRRHERARIGSWISLSHPLLGEVTGEVRNVSHGGLCLTTDNIVGCYVMMELQARLHGEAQYESRMPVPVQMVRIKGSEIAVRFLNDQRPRSHPRSA